jgi:hypothetical protein
VLLDILRAGLELLLPEPRARAASSAGSSGCCALRVLEPAARSASAQGTSSERRSMRGSLRARRPRSAI